MYNIFTKQTTADNFFVIDTIEPSIGSTVQATAEDMMEILRVFLRQPRVALTQAVAGSSAKVPVVKTVFNGIELIAKAGWSSAESIVEDYMTESNRRAEEYKNSPEGKEAEKRRQQEIKVLEIKRDELMVQLNNLDWDNLEAVIDWLCDMQEASDHVGVSVDKETVLNAFTSNNYQVGGYCGEDFKKDDREIFALWLIGQGLSTLESVSIHPIIHKFAKEWKEKQWIPMLTNGVTTPKVPEVNTREDALNIVGLCGINDYEQSYIELAIRTKLFRYHPDRCIEGEEYANEMTKAILKARKILLGK